MRQQSLQSQKALATRMEDKGNSLIEYRKLGDQGHKELSQLMNALPHVKAERKLKTLKDQYHATAKYTYDLPPMIVWN